MFNHVTLVRYSRDCPERTTAEALLGARSLLAQIPTVARMSCGPALESTAHDWDVIFEFMFDTPAGFEQFAAHPLHEEFVERHIHPHAEVVTSIDFDDRATEPIAGTNE